MGISIVAVTGNPRVHPIYRYRRGLILSGLGGLIFHTQREATYDESVWCGQLVCITPLCKGDSKYQALADTGWRDLKESEKTQRRRSTNVTI